MAPAAKSPPKYVQLSNFMLTTKPRPDIWFQWWDFKPLKLCFDWSCYISSISHHSLHNLTMTMESYTEIGLINVETLKFKICGDYTYC